MAFTKPFLNAPIQPLVEDGHSEIEVIDPMHPLFGRRFTVAFLSHRYQEQGMVVVQYQGDIRLSIPIAVTNLGLPPVRLGTKLTLKSVTDLVMLIQHWEVLCLSPLVKSGSNSIPCSKPQSAKT